MTDPLSIAHASAWPKQALATLSRHRSLFFGTVLVVLSVNALVLSALDNLYKAEATVQVDHRQKFIDRSSLLSPLNVETGALKSEIDRIRAPATALRVIEQLHLFEETEFRRLGEPGLVESARAYLHSALAGSGGDDAASGGGLAAPLRTWLAPPDEVRQRLKFRADVLEYFLDHLEILNEPRSHTLRIRYTSRDPELSARVANAVSDLYIRSELAAKHQVAEIADDWYSKELADLQANVQRAEQRLANFREAHQLGSHDVPPPSQQQLSNLNEKLIIAAADYAQAKSRYDEAQQAARANRLGSLQDALASPTVQYLQQRRSDLNRRLAELKQKYGDRHIRVVETRAQLTELDRKVREELSKILASLRSEASVALSRRNALQAALDKLQTVVAEKDHQQVQLRAYEREAEASRALLTSVLQRSKELRAASGLQQPGVKLVSAALVPVEPSSPKVMLIFALGGVCAVILAFSAVFVADSFNQTVRSLKQGESMLGIPALGWIPKTKRVDHGTVHEIPVDRPFAPYSEAIRSLATLLRTRQSVPGSILLVASAAPREGKTTFALSYALSLALARQSCLLIDADLRRPAVARRLQGEPGAGFADVLQERVSLWDAIEREERTGLNYLAAGTCDNDPLEIFSSAAVEGLLRTAAARYQHVILDVPPLLAVSDALLLARFCDAAVVVVKWGVTPGRLAEKAARQLRVAGIEDVSFVLSQVDVRRLSRMEDEHYSAEYLRKYDGEGGPVIRLRKERQPKLVRTASLNWADRPSE